MTTDTTPAGNLAAELVNCTDEPVYVVSGKTIHELRRHHGLTIVEVGSSGNTLNVRAGNSADVCELTDDNLADLEVIVIADLEPCDGVIWLVDSETAARYAYRDDIVTPRMYLLLRRDKLDNDNYDLSQLGPDAANLSFISILCGISRGAGRDVTETTPRVA